MSVFTDDYGLTGLGIVAIFLAWIAIVGLGSFFWDKKSCSVVATKMELQHQYGFWQNCLVRNHNGQWVSLDNYKSVNLEK